MPSARNQRVAAALVIVTLCTAAWFHLSRALHGSEFEHYRKILLSHFTASDDLISFSVPLSADTSGLLLIVRRTGELKIIYDQEVVLRSPFLSRDGKRLIFVKGRVPPNENKELVSCIISSWRCRAVLKTTATIVSPMEIAPDAILYSSSPIRKVGDRMRSDHHDLFLLKNREDLPIKLTNIDSYQLSALSVSGRQLLFSAVGAASTIVPVPDPLVSSKSVIFSLEFTEDYRIDLSRPPLRREFALEGYSSDPSMSPDGQYLAFSNRRNDSGGAHFNIAIADAGGNIVCYIMTPQYGFSRPVFVGGSIVASELHDDRYDIVEYPLPDGKGRVLFRVDNAPDSLRKLQTIPLLYEKSQSNS